MVGALGCHGWAPMSNIPLVSDLQATVSVTEIVPPHREPAHPAVIARRCGTGQRLPDLALMAQAAGPMMPLHHTRVDDVVPEEIQAVLQASFAMHDAHRYSFHPTPFILFFDLPIGQPLRPAQERPPGSTW